MSTLAAFGPRSWADTNVLSIGRLSSTTYFERGERVGMEEGWRFSLFDRPEDVTVTSLSGSTASWAQIDVPGCWTMQGYDRPQYTNVVMPFEERPPEVPDLNPTGVYRRRVTLPSTWQGRRIVLHVAGAESVLYVHVDGKPVGMGKDSRLPQEFDLTGVVEPDVAFDLALTVVRWSDATYLEDQDHWYHAGLHRSVFCYSTPLEHLADVHAVADYDPASGEAALRLTAHFDLPAARAAPRGWVVRAEVAGQSAEAPVRVEHPTNTTVNVAALQVRGASFTLAIPGVLPWSAEQPNLYPVRVSLVDDGGIDVDRVTLDVGFRRVEVRGCELLVNGRAILVKGVNRHDHDPRQGKAVTAAGIERDVALMKQHNLNALRTSHYPNDAALYEICDRLGMYVVDEANVESHAYLRSLSKDPRWTAPILDRVVRMAQRDKNHACVIMWSLGNESGVAPVHRAAAEWLRSYDGTRPVHYESGISEDEMAARSRGEEPDLAALLARRRPESDVIAPMYPSVGSLVEWATVHDPDRPLVMCEYCHAMGNSCGGLADYWEAIRAHRGLQGGFVWDWVDQALVQRLPDGTERLAYGGDFGDVPNDGAFCLNGLVAADRTPHPSLLELAKVLQPLRVELLDGASATVRVTNEWSFEDASRLVGSWELTADGEQIAAGPLGRVSVPPGGSTDLPVPVPRPLPLALAPVGAVRRAQARVDLMVSFATAEDSPSAPAGHVVAWEQMTLRPSGAPSRAPRSLRDDRMPVADLSVYEPTLSLWRAPIDNEIFGPRHAERWERLGLPAVAAEIPFDTRSEIDEGDEGDEGGGTDEGGAGNDRSASENNGVRPSGLRIIHTVEVPRELDDIARVGVRLRLGAGVHSVDWLGVGPHECYSDRRQSGRFGRYSTLVDDWPVPYVHPQASGNRVGVRWLRLLDDEGRVLLTVDEMDDLEVTVSRFTDEQVAAATHLEDLVARDECYVWIDARHRGVGSGACGPDTGPEHRIAPGTYRWSYRIS